MTCPFFLGRGPYPPKEISITQPLRERPAAGGAEANAALAALAQA